MKDNAGLFRIGWMAKALDVSTSGYHACLKWPESRRKRENRRLSVETNEFTKMPEGRFMRSRYRTHCSRRST